MSLGLFEKKWRRSVPDTRRRRVSAKVAVITGAGRGIGRATALALAAEGYAVVIAELRADLGRRTERALRKAGLHALFVRTDVTSPASIDKAIRAVVRRFGRIDCLVNNAGVLTRGTLAGLPVPDVEQMLAVNLRGPILFSRAVLPVMLRRHSGSIVNVASQLGQVGMAEYATYCASKFGVVGFTDALADELAGTEIAVWAVCPGQVDTAMARRAGASAAERPGLIRPETVARVIAELATGRRRPKSGSAVDVS